jgi:hypothetical protein
VARDPARFTVWEQIGCGAPAGLILEIDVGERLPGAILYDKALD